jgi:hypothetical protein
VFRWLTDVAGLPSRVGDEYLMPTERVVDAVRRHPVSIIGPVLFIALGTIFALVLFVDSHSKGVRLIIFLLWLALLGWQGWKVAKWWRTVFAVTENRLMLVTSLFYTDVGMMPLAKVTDMRLLVSTFGRLLEYGEFIVESAGQEQALSRVKYVPHPSEMYQEILALIFPGKSQQDDPGFLALAYCEAARGCRSAWYQPRHEPGTSGGP